ncbi:MAG TPA: DUF4173 domain-containing protein [Gaiellaceae bacterium]
MLAAALGLGALGDALLRATPWGLNVAIWVLALAAAATLLLRRVSRGRLWLCASFLGFGLATAWRDSTTLKALDLFAAAVSLALAFLPRSTKVRQAGLAEVGGGIVRLGWGATSGTFSVLFEDVSWDEVPRGRLAVHAVAVGRGLAIGVPLLLVFGGLFVAADAVFQGLVTDALRVGNPLTHLAIAVVCAWVAAGVLRSVVVPAKESAPGRSAPSLGIVETCVVLGVLDALFAAFVAVQFRAAFGGAAYVERTTSLTYAAYARRGFFELVVVAALALPLLVAADWLVERRSRRDTILFRALAGLLIALLFVVMASALERMRLYQRAYGLTELRLYSTAFMLWLAAVCCWFLATVLRGRRRAFAVGVVVTGLAAVLTLNVLNPDGLVARIDVDRARPMRHPLDVRYVTHLSADAVPTLVARLDRMRPEGRAAVARALLHRWGGASHDWRTWSLARATAERTVRSHRAELEAAARY